MTTKSSLCDIQSRLETRNSIHNMTSNGNDARTSRICVKKPLSSTSFLPNNSPTNGFSTHLKKRTIQLNNFFHPKRKSNHSNGTSNGHPLNEESLSPAHVFHAIAPVSPEQTKLMNDELKSIDDTSSLATQRVARVLAHTNIKAMSTDPRLIPTQSSFSEEDEHRLKCQSNSSYIDADADESDNGNYKNIKKSRRLQKVHRTSNSSIPSKDEQQHHRSSSNEDDSRESTINGNGNTEQRKSKLSFTKKSHQPVATTTTDDEVKKQYHRYHPLDNLEVKVSTTTTPNESNFSSPVSTTKTDQAVGKKVNRFQVKSIRKSQQQHILLANTAAAKSSNEDDCSVPNGKSNAQLKPSVIERKHTHTPTTDGETSTAHADAIVNGTAPTLNTTEKGPHRVRFHVTPHVRQESAAEEDKSANQIVITPAPPSSTVSVHREDDEGEEAVAKSPDNRFIKYAEEIGRGAFKTVYRGLDTETSVAVAWCELQDFAQFDKHERARFKEEAEMLKKLQHPNIVRFYDFWEETNPRTNKKVIILVTELMTSGSLKGYIRNFRGQKEDKRINVMKKWCRQILKGLAYLHSRSLPVIHRDLKCDNVFISSTTGCVKIGDLGLATFKTQTFAKSMRGTMEFMAPEMFDEQYDELVDIYSFGLCMLEMITGEYPYIECKGPTAVIKRVTNGLKPECYYKVENEDVREVIDCCIRTNKEERLCVHDLLQHSFFLEDNGLRVEVIRDSSTDLQVLLSDDSIDLKLKIVDKVKRKALWTEHDAIRFRYTFTTETPEQIVDELIEKKYIFEDDKKFVVQSIKDRLRAVQYELIDRKAGVFCRGGKPTINQTSQSAFSGQQQQQIPPPQQLPSQMTPAILPQPQLTSLTPISSSVQQSQTVHPTKPIVITEPIPIAPLSELSSSVSGSAGSLEILDAALKKTFTKTNPFQNASTTTSTVTNDNSEPPTPNITQDDTSVARQVSETTLNDQQQVEESVGLITGESISIPSSTLHSQSQPSASQNLLLSTQTPRSFSSSSTSPSQTPSNPFIPQDPTKTSIPSSTVIDTTSENNYPSISPSTTIDNIQSALNSDTSSTNPLPILGSLKQLDALLKNTFKNSTKATGTAHNSDTETTNTNGPSISLPINDDKSIETDSIAKPDECKQNLLELFNSSNPSESILIKSQPNISSLILPKSIQQQSNSQPSSQVSVQFDPLQSPEREGLVKGTTGEKLVSNDDTIVAASSLDFSEIKLMIVDLSKTVLNRMNVLEDKIDEHRNQTVQINHLLTQTILPSLSELTDIIHQTPDIDSRVRTKLENIQKNIRTSQQRTEMKDLMEI